MLLRTTSEEAASTVADSSLDAVFLDGDHSAAGIEADILAWMPKVSNITKLLQ